MMTIILRGKQGEYQVQMHRAANGGYTAVECGTGAQPEESKNWDSLNPLETFTSMVMRLECIGRRAIGQWFEENGRNRYTGAPETKE